MNNCSDENVEINLQHCYDIDIDWSLIPSKLENVCSAWAKTMKQRKTTVLIAIASLVSFMVGHASITVKEEWEEPIIVWLAIVLKTGRCKSAMHRFLERLIERVDERTTDESNAGQRTMLLPHCTWDKFGEILAKNGGKLYGLFDEMISFFSTMSMYSSSRGAVQDNREYQDFLKMFTGKSKNRETITGNANFKMSQTSLTLLGFTQPQSALPIIHNAQNNAKGFTSRILWFFPSPIYSRFKDLQLTTEEKEIVDDGEEVLLNLLTNLHLAGEMTHQISEKDKLIEVAVTRDTYELSQDARDVFSKIYDDWEINLCKRYQNDDLISGLFARGNSHVIRLAVPLHCLFRAFNDTNPEDDYSTSSPEDPDVIESTQESNETETSQPNTNQQKIIEPPAILAAHSIVETCLRHCCIMNNRGDILNDGDIHDNPTQSSQCATPVRTSTKDPLQKFYKAILLTPGPVVSASVMISKGKFRRLCIENETGAAAGRKLFEILSAKGLGQMLTYRVSNNITTTFLKKKNIPDDPEMKQAMATALSTFGVSLRSYSDMFNKENELSNLHSQDYQNRRKRSTDSTSEEPPHKTSRTEDE